MTGLIHARVATVAARAYNGQWIGDCPWCNCAMPLERFALGMVCGICHVPSELLWPSEAMVAGVERLLLMRPNPANRNWRPGETLPELMWENGLHGVYNNLTERGIEAAPGESLLSVVDDHMTWDRLPALMPLDLEAVLPGTAQPS